MLEYRSFSDLAAVIRQNLDRLRGYNPDLVVGIPRSGMFPAYAIALHLNIPCTDFQSFVENRPLQKGCRSLYKEVSHPHQASSILIVDDSILSGASILAKLNEIPPNLKGKVFTVTVYSDKAVRSEADLVLDVVSAPRVFEWNLYHNYHLSKTMFDLDGVICIDPTEGENDDGEKYDNFIRTTSPLHLPSRKVHSIVTNRLEKFRSATEEWLSSKGVEYNNLIMLNLPDKASRLASYGTLKHKHLHYKNSDAFLFIESSYKQAVEISAFAGKDVFCVETNELIKPGLAAAMVKNPDLWTRYFIDKAKHSLSPFYRKFIKS